MTKPFDYTSKSNELNEVLENLQSPSIHVDEAIKLYELGIGLVSEIEAYLKEAEMKITKIKAS